jgi:hypothetical protein
MINIQHYVQQENNPSSITSKASVDVAVDEISTSWHKSVENILKTANLIRKFSFTDEWKAIQEELINKKIMKSSVISMMMRISSNTALNNPQNLNYLPPSYNSLYNLSIMSPDVIERKINDGEICSSTKLEEIRGWSPKKQSNPRKKIISLIKIELDDYALHKNDLIIELKKILKQFPFLLIKE